MNGLRSGNPEVLNTVLTMNGKDTSDEDKDYEDEEDILIYNSEAALAIETLQRYLRQREASHQ